MSLSTSQAFIVMAVFFIVYSIYSTWKLKDEVYCTFIRQDRTEINKYAKINQRKVDFDGAWYNIVPNRVTLKMVWKGIVPTWVKCLKFKWDSNMPLDPTTWNNTYDNPTDRKALNRSEAIQSLMTKQNTLLGAKGGKKTMLESLMPIIIIAGFLIMGYMVWKMQGQNDQLGFAMNTLQSQFVDLQKALGK